MLVTNRTGPGPAQLHITGEVTDELAREVRAELRTLHGRELEVLVDSRGGSYAAGVAIFNALRRHRGGVTTAVDSYAASAASMIVMAADRRLMAPGSRLMIHDPSLTALPGGTAYEIAQAAVVMAGKANDLAGVYADRAGGTVDEWRQRMIAGTTFSAAEAVEFGLATAVDWTRAPVTASTGSRSVIKYLPGNRIGPDGTASPYTGRRSDEHLSVFDPYWRTSMLRAQVIVASMDARRTTPDEVRRAKWVGTCIADALYNHPHPVVQALAARARAN